MKSLEGRMPSLLLSATHDVSRVLLDVTCTERIKTEMDRTAHIGETNIIFLLLIRRIELSPPSSMCTFEERKRACY